jgi:transposase, IS5 family
VVAVLEALTRIETRRIHVDKGYRGHNHGQKFRVWISGQIRREMRRRAAVEPVIGHIKAEHRMGRHYLKGRDGDRINAVLAAAGYNFRLLLRWLERLLRALIWTLLPTRAGSELPKQRSSSVLHGRPFRHYLGRRAPTRAGHLWAATAYTCDS